MNRRYFIAAIVGALVCGSSREARTPTAQSPLETTLATTKPIQESQQREIEYIQIGQPRYREDSGFRTVSLNFEVDKQFWQNLPKGLSKKGFYNQIRGAPFRSITNTIFNGVVVIHDYPISNEDIVQDSIKSADIYISNTSNENFYELDPNLRFTKSDKDTLKELLEENITSPIKQLIGLFSQREVQIFPPRTQIIFEKGKGNPKITLRVNTNRDTNQNPKYAPDQVYEIDNPEKSEIFTKMLRLALLTEDPKAEDIGLIPIDRLYKVYQKRNNQ